MDEPELNRAFTLIEILVVVAIIALLIAVLLPSLARARAQGRAIKCQANERQFGVSATIFSSEHKGKILRSCGTFTEQPAGSGRFVNRFNWMGAVARMLGDRRNYTDANSLNVPLDKIEVFHCPERTMTHPGPYLDYVVNGLDSRGPVDSNCVPNINTGQWVEVTGAENLDVWKQPSDTIYIMDAARENEETFNGKGRLYSGRVGTDPQEFDVWTGGHVPFYQADIDGSSYQPAAALTMHLGSGSNAVFADGHVARVVPLPRRASDPDPKLANWQFYLRKFGVRFASVSNPIKKANNPTPSFFMACRAGDPYFSP